MYPAVTWWVAGAGSTIRLDWPSSGPICECEQVFKTHNKALKPCSTRTTWGPDSCHNRLRRQGGSICAAWVRQWQLPPPPGPNLPTPLDPVQDLTTTTHDNIKPQGTGCLGCGCMRFVCGPACVFVCVLLLLCPRRMGTGRPYTHCATDISPDAFMARDGVVFVLYVVCCCC
jgi:hypothetical protein